MVQTKIIEQPKLFTTDETLPQSKSPDETGREIMRPKRTAARQCVFQSKSH